MIDMTVKELIKALKKCPKDYVVMMTEDITSPIEDIGIDHDHQMVELYIV